MMARRIKKSLFAVFLPVLGVAFVPPALSANLIATPGVAVDERWDSNITNTSTDEQSDYVFRASPRLTLTLETLRAPVSLTGGIEYENYSRNSDLNGRTATTFNLVTPSPLRFTPRFSLSPSAYFVETNDPVRRNLLTEASSSELPPSETVVTARTKSREFGGVLSFRYRLTPNVDVGLRGGGTKRTFLDNNAGAIDSDTISGGASIAYRFTPRLSSGLNIDVSRNTFENDTDSRNYDAGLSLTYLLSEQFTFEARGGASYLKESTASGDDTVASPSGRLSLSYNLRDFRAALLGSYDLAGGGSFGVTTRRLSIRMTLSDRFSPNWWWDVSGSYQTNRSLDTPTTEDISAWYGNAGLRYRAAEWASFRLSGNMVRQRARNSVEGADLDRNAVMLGLDLNKAYKLF